MSKKKQPKNQGNQKKKEDAPAWEPLPHRAKSLVAILKELQEMKAMSVSELEIIVSYVEHDIVAILQPHACLRMQDDVYKLAAYPGGKKKRLRPWCLEFLTLQMDGTRKYDESEMTQHIRNLVHPTLLEPDPISLRREMYESGVIDRTGDGREYWKVTAVKPYVRGVF